MSFAQKTRDDGWTISTEPQAGAPLDGREEAHRAANDVEMGHLSGDPLPLRQQCRAASKWIRWPLEGTLERNGKGCSKLVSAVLTSF